MAGPPETARDPVTETRHGQQIVDPYRWLEDDDEAVTDWEHEQNEYTDSVVETDYRDSLVERLSAVAEHTTYHVPSVAGGRYFQRIEAPDADQPQLTVRECRDDDPRTLVDPADLGETTALQWYVPRPDGKRVLYGLTDAGTEQYDLRVLDVDSGEIVDSVDDVGRCGDLMVGWLDDSFYYTESGSAGEGGQLEKAIRYREVGGPDRLVTDDIPVARWPTISTDADSGLAIAALGELGSDVELYALSDGLEPVVTDVDASFQPLVHAGRVYLLTNHEADRFRVLATEAEEFAGADGLDAFETVLPEGEDVLFDIAPAGDGIAVHRLRDAASVVSLHDADGTKRHELSLPPHAGVGRDAFNGSGETGEVMFGLDGFDRPTEIVHADAGPTAGPDDWEVHQRPELPDGLDPAKLDLTVEYREVESADGTDVPMYVVHRADLAETNPPTVLYGYGGFRIPLLPELDPYRLPFLADGGVFAQVCARGGLEFGERWHDGGAGASKEHTFEDFEAAAELLAEEYTTADRLAAWGGSNGGLTVGAAVTRRPELFGAAISNVPLLDMLRFHRFLLGAAWTAEYESPEDPDAFETLLSYSPYHNVDERTYPATLFATAAGDTRVHPAHARKMTARVQAATAGGGPVCFRSYDEAGHGLGTPTELEVEQAADKWSFLAQALTVE